MAGRLPRKVLHVLNGAGGGAALTTISLVKGLDRLGVRSCAVCHAMGSDDEWGALREVFGGELEAVDLYWWNKKVRSVAWKRPLIEARQWLRTGATLGSTTKVASLASKWGAELIHTNTFLTPEGARAARLLRLPHVWHVRELIGVGQPFQVSLSDGRLARFLERSASVVVANSEASAAGVRAMVPPERLKVVPNGIELDRFAGPKVPRRELPVVGMVANLTSRTKRHGLFVEAMAQLRGVATGCIYGGGADRNDDSYVVELRQAAERAGVELRGFAAPEQIMAALDVLVQPAENESFGRTVIEAMAGGVAVVGAAGGGVGALIDDGEDGLTFTPGSVDELVAAIRTVVTDEPLRARLAGAGRAKAQACYSVDAMTRGIAEAYALAMRFPLHASWEGLAVAMGLT